MYYNYLGSVNLQRNCPSENIKIYQPRWEVHQSQNDILTPNLIIKSNYRVRISKSKIVL